MGLPRAEGAVSSSEDQFDRAVRDLCGSPRGAEGQRCPDHSEDEEEGIMHSQNARGGRRGQRLALQGGEMESAREPFRASPADVPGCGPTSTLLGLLLAVVVLVFFAAAAAVTAPAAQPAPDPPPAVKIPYEALLGGGGDEAEAELASTLEATQDGAGPPTSGAAPEAAEGAPAAPAGGGGNASWSATVAPAGTSENETGAEESQEVKTELLDTGDEKGDKEESAKAVPAPFGTPFGEADWEYQPEQRTDASAGEGAEAGASTSSAEAPGGVLDAASAEVEAAAEAASELQQAVGNGTVGAAPEADEAPGANGTDPEPGAEPLEEATSEA